MSGTFQNGAFDTFAHTAEMRRVGSRSGRCNIPNIGIFLWRVQALKLGQVPLVAAGWIGRRFRFDPLGTDKPLYGEPRTEEDITHIAEPFDVPLPLPRRWLGGATWPTTTDLVGLLQLETEAASGTDPVDASAIRICDLSDDPASPGAWAHEPQPAATHVAIDPVLGRVAYPARSRGGHVASGYVPLRDGPRNRRRRIRPGGLTPRCPHDRSRRRRRGAWTGARNRRRRRRRLRSRTAAPMRRRRRLRLPRRLPEPPMTPVTLRAVNRARPLLARSGQLKLAMEPDTSVILDGLVLAGAPLVIEESADARPRTLILRHCTLVPGRTASRTAARARLVSPA